MGYISPVVLQNGRLQQPNYLDSQTEEHSVEGE